MIRTAYNRTMEKQPDEPEDFTNEPLPSMSEPMEVQDAVASTLATPFAQPIIAASKSKAQKQREYRQRIAASRTPAQVAAARKSKNERQRNNRLRQAANLAIVASTSATSFAEPITAAPKTRAQIQREYRQRIAASKTPAQAAAAREARNVRDRNNRLCQAANLAIASGSLEATTTSSSRSGQRLNTVHIDTQRQFTNQQRQTLATEPAETTVQPSTSSDQIEVQAQSTWNTKWPSSIMRFKSTFLDNDFGYACSVCDRLWFRNDLKPITAAQLKRQDSSSGNNIKVFCPKCNAEVSQTAEGIHEDKTKILIAKVYHYFEQENEELKRMYGNLNLTPLSKFRQRTALATGVSETTLLQILKEEEGRNVDQQREPPQEGRAAHKRRRQTDSSSVEDSSDDNVDDFKQPSYADDEEPEIDIPPVKVEPSDDDINRISVVKIEPPESNNEEPEIFVPAEIKLEPGDGEMSNEEPEIYIPPVKVEPSDDDINRISVVKIEPPESNNEEPEIFVPAEIKLEPSDGEMGNEEPEIYILPVKVEPRDDDINSVSAQVPDIADGVSESTKASTTEVQTITSRKKTNAQRCREYRERKKLQNTMVQNITAERSDECSETDQLPAKKPKTNAERRKKHYDAQKLKKQASKKIPKTGKQRNKEYYERKKKIQALNTLNRHSDAISVEPPESNNEEPEIFVPAEIKLGPSAGEMSNEELEINIPPVKVEPSYDDINREQTDPISVHVKTEPRYDEVDTAQFQMVPISVDVKIEPRDDEVDTAQFQMDPISVDVKIEPRDDEVDTDIKEKKRIRNREYQRAWRQRQRKKKLKKKDSKEKKEEDKRKRHRENQRAYYQRTKRLKENDKNVEELSQMKLDDLQIKREKLDGNEDQENVVQCRASQNLENVQLKQNQFLTQQLGIYEESHKCITPKVILHRNTDIPGDGNCLFHSLIRVLQLQILTCDLRRQLRDSPYLNSCQNPQEAHNILSSNDEYGDLDCLYLFAKIYNQNVCVHYHYFNVISKIEDTRYCHFKANDTHNWIHLDLREQHFTPYLTDDEKIKEDEIKQKQKNKEYSKRYRDKKRTSNLQTAPSARDVLDVKPVIHTTQIAGPSTGGVLYVPPVICSSQIADLSSRDVPSSLSIHSIEDRVRQRAQLQTDPLSVDVKTEPRDHGVDTAHLQTNTISVDVKTEPRDDEVDTSCLSGEREIKMEIEEHEEGFS